MMPFHQDHSAVTYYGCHHEIDTVISLQMVVCLKEILSLVSSLGRIHLCQSQHIHQQLNYLFEFTAYVASKDRCVLGSRW